MQDHADAHAERLKDFETRLEKVNQKSGVNDLNSPWFGVLVALKRGIGFEREYLEWCNWMLDCFKS
jgi:hypothetical protein